MLDIGFAYSCKIGKKVVLRMFYLDSQKLFAAESESKTLLNFILLQDPPLGWIKLICFANVNFCNFTRVACRGGAEGARAPP